jgi:hypothetical protein
MLNVFENLHRAIAKPSLTKLLDKLVDKCVLPAMIKSMRAFLAY